MDGLTEDDLMRRHWPLVLYAVRRYRPPGLDPDEALSAAQLAALQALRDHDPARSRLGTYLVQKARWAMLDLVKRRAGRRARPIQAPLPDGDLLPARPDEGGLETLEYFAWLTRPLLPAERAVVEGVYRDGRTLAQVGADLGLSASRCSLLLSEALEFLRYRLGAA